MKIFNLFVILFFASASVFSKSAGLSPETFSSAQLTFILDKTIKLNQKNKYRFPIIIDSNNRCVFLTKGTKLNLPQNTEWKSQSSIDWNDWDSKTYNFKLTNKTSTVQLNCELNLSGEMLLFNSNAEKKSAKACKKQGGQVQNIPPKSYTRVKSQNSDRAPASTVIQTYCVKKIPKVSLSKFKSAFQKAKVKVHVEYSTDQAPASEF